MTAHPDEETATGGTGLSNTAQTGGTDEAMAQNRAASDLGERDEDVLNSMIESYEQAVVSQQKFIERSSDADRKPMTSRSRHRRVRVATTAERRESGK
jgi:hypothetical protein